VEGYQGATVQYIPSKWASKTKAESLQVQQRRPSMDVKYGVIATAVQGEV